MLRHILVISAIVVGSTVLYQAAGTTLGQAELAAATSSPTSQIRLVGSEAAPTLTARAYAVAYLDNQTGGIEMLLERNANLPLPIASITKLMTARVAARFLSPDQVVVIAPEDIVERTDFSGLSPGEVATADSLMRSLLVESSNYAAAALARTGGGNDFVAAMNREARLLGMDQTIYYNPSGLDPAGLGGDALNRSSGYDLVRLAAAVLADDPELLSITQTQTAPFYTADGGFHHLITTTNQLLGTERWPAEIAGGKTGRTDLAEKNLLLVLKNKQGSGHLIAVVLGAEDHFAEMSRLLDWTYRNYQFQQS